MSTVTARAINWTESGLVPDTVIRSGIRRLLDTKVAEIAADDVETAADTVNDFVEMMLASPVALVPELANEQHYEVPAEFFEQVLGTWSKYSCSYWPDGVTELDEAEFAALEVTVTRAQIEDGMRILDLGCGWGSLSLFIAERFPTASVVAVSNSVAQRGFIRKRAAARGIENLEVVTADMNDFQAPGHYDRIVSVEMFEHMRNYRELFGRVHDWLNPGGRFFMHIFCHRSTPYEFLDQGESDWMSRYFFSGGIMPSDDLPLRFQDRLRLVRQWRWNGAHYERTSNAWLDNMDERREEIMPIMQATYGHQDAAKWFQRWRIFFMACAELFGLRSGSEWYVAHYLFRRGEDAPEQEVVR